jgi:uncharacterized protein (TIGR02186 family)
MIHRLFDIYVSILTLVIAIFLLVQPAHSKPLVADISSNFITIHTAFEGTELMLFGARNDPGDIVVVIRGPMRDATVRRKDRIFGIWVNRTQEVFESIPGFYALAASRQYEQIEKSIYFDSLGIGYEEAITPPRLLRTAMMAEDERAQREIFSRALLRELRQRNLYGTLTGEVEFIGETLFKVRIPFPDNVPRGEYTAEVYLFSDGELMGGHTSPISVHKTGFDAFVYEMAHENPLTYGILAVIVALVAGWMASFIFERL